MCGRYVLKAALPDIARMLGMDVDLAIEKESLGIRFTVDSEEVRDALRSHLAELHRALGEHGWSAESVDIDLRGENEFATPSGGDDAPASGESSETESEELPREIRLRHLGRSVDLRG